MKLIVKTNLKLYTLEGILNILDNNIELVTQKTVNSPVYFLKKKGRFD